MNYCLPLLPKDYWIKSIDYKCEDCSVLFNILIPNGDEIVKFKIEGTEEIRWLPTFEKGGYLYLISKLMPNFNKETELTVSFINSFIVKLRNYVKENVVLYETRHCCPKCGSKKLQISQEKIIKNPKVKWLEIDCSLL
jgi:Zn finger protein HypA/HybF involved in hydrogenase expression